MSSSTAFQPQESKILGALPTRGKVQGVGIFTPLSLLLHKVSCPPAKDTGMQGKGGRGGVFPPHFEAEGGEINFPLSKDGVCMRRLLQFLQEKADLSCPFPVGR